MDYPTASEMRALKEFQRYTDTMKHLLPILPELSPGMRQAISVIEQFNRYAVLPENHLKALEGFRALLTPDPTNSAALTALRNFTSPELEMAVQGVHRSLDAFGALGVKSDPIASANASMFESLAGIAVIAKESPLSESMRRFLEAPLIQYDVFARAELELAKDVSGSQQLAHKMAAMAGSHLIEGLVDCVQFPLALDPKLARAVVPPLGALPTFGALAAISRLPWAEQPPDEVQRAFESSAPVLVQELGRRIVELIFFLSTDAERVGRDATFRPTTRSSFAGVAIASTPVCSEAEFSEVVDHLYFLLYEGSGDAKRLLLLAAKEDLDLIWKLKSLRRGFRHDLEHGDKAEIRKKLKELGAIYVELTGTEYPRQPEEWAIAQHALYGHIVATLEAIWFGDRPN